MEFHENFLKDIIDAFTPLAVPLNNEKIEASAVQENFCAGELSERSQIARSLLRSVD